MAEDVLIRKCHCPECKTFTNMTFRQIGIHKKISVVLVIFKYWCPCGEEDIEEMSFDDWTSLETEKYTHYNLIDR